MKNQLVNWTSQIVVKDFMPGESIEEKMRQATQTHEPIDTTAPIIYTERKDGVLAEYDIRTDRWEVAQEAMDKVSKSHIARREEALKLKEEQTPNNE